MKLIRTKLIILTLIVMGNALSSLAEGETSLPPPLPPSFTDLNNNTSENNEGIWNKIKIFFGFGEKNNKSTDDPEENLNDDLTPPNQSPEEANGPTDEGPVKDTIAGAAEVNNNINDPAVKQEPEIEADTEEDVPDLLQLPEGFGEEDYVPPKPTTAEKTPAPTEGPIAGLPKEDRNLNSTTDKPEEDAAKQHDIISNEEQITPINIPSSLDKESSSSDINHNDLNQAAPTHEETTKNTDNNGQDEDTNIDPVEPEIKAEIITPKTTESKEADNILNSSDKETVNEPKIEVPDYTKPSYKPQSSNILSEDSVVSKYQQELNNKVNNQVSVPKITDSDLSITPNANNTGSTAESLQFINNEAQVIILPNDDVVLGELTEEAYLDLMDFRSYVDIFWDKYNRLAREPKKQEIKKFIENYDEIFN